MLTVQKETPLLSPLQREDVPSMIEAEALATEAGSSFRHEQFYPPHLRPPLEVRIARQIRIAALSPPDVSSSSTHFQLKATLPNSSDPAKVIGHAHWILTTQQDLLDAASAPIVPPFAIKEGDSDEAVRLKKEMQGIMDLGFYKRYREIGGKVKRRVMGETGRSVWYLSFLFTHPDYQRRGIARALVKFGTDLADRDQLPCALTSSPSGQALYISAGFETKAICQMAYEVDGKEVIREWPAMVREPLPLPPSCNAST